MAWIRLDAEGRVVGWTVEALGLLGQDPESLEGTLLGDLLEEDDPGGLDEALRRLSRDPPTGEGEAVPRLVVRALEGPSLPLELSLAPAGPKNQEPRQVLCLLRNLSGEREGRARLDLLESSLELLEEALVVTDGRMEGPGPEIIFANRAFASLFGNFPGTLRGRRVRQVIGEALWERLLPLVASGIEAGEPIAGEAVLGPAGTGEVLVEWEVEPLRDDAGGISHFVARLREVNGLGGTEGADEGLGVDPATGLPDRDQFVSRLGRSVSWARESRTYRFAVLCIEPQGIASLRSTLGPLVATQVLKAVGWRLRRTIRPTDLVARMEDSRLVLLLEHPGAPHEIDLVVSRIRKALAPPFTIAGNTLTVRPLMGIALSDTGYELPEQVIRDALRALDRARSRARGAKEGYAVFDAARVQESRSRARTIAQLRGSVSDGGNGRLSVVFQPIVELNTGRPAGLEALMRWRNSEGALLAAGEVLPFLEEGRLLDALGPAVLRGAVKGIAQWRRELPDSLPPVSLNLSEEDLRNERFLRDLPALLDENGLHGEGLAFEIPERAVRRDPEGIVPALERLNATGAELWLDGFGGQGAPLIRLGDLPWRKVKVHPALVGGLGRKDGVAARALDALLALVHTLELEVVAVGIENRAQLEEARDRGIRLGQGFLLSGLLESPTVATYLREKVAGG